METCTRYWFGCTVKDGKPVRDMTTPASVLNEEFVKRDLIHATVEAQQLSKFLPALYAEYKDKPDDAD